MWSQIRLLRFEKAERKRTSQHWKLKVWSLLNLKGTIREEVCSWAPNVKGNKEALQTHSSHLLLEWMWIQCGVDELDMRATLPCLRLIVVLRIQWNKTTLFCPTRHVFYLRSTSYCHPTGVRLNRGRNSFVPQSIKNVKKVCARRLGGTTTTLMFCFLLLFHVSYFCGNLLWGDFL